MEKFIKEYGVILLLYFIIVLGVVALNSRMKNLNMNMDSQVSFSQRGFTN